MFIQVIQGMCSDEATLRRQMDRWREDLAPGADGWLGGTYGMTDDGQFVGVVRFESREAAARNSLRPEQGEWWAAVEKCFDGEVIFHDCDEAIMMLDGGSDDAGFVQVIQGRLDDPARFREFMSQPMDMLQEARPEIIGGTDRHRRRRLVHRDHGVPQRGRGPQGRADGDARGDVRALHP